jgi:hypothetical protein
MIPRRRCFLLAAWLALVPGAVTASDRSGDMTDAPPRGHRLIVLTDVENEPDDTQSLVRLMLYTNCIDIQGLIATTSIHLKNRVAPESIARVIRGYGQVRDNLLQHEPGFPTEAALLALVKAGQPSYGLAAVGNGKDSEGSDWIIRVLDQPDDRPLWVTAWGGANTLAQALFKLRQTRSEAELKRLIAKLRVYTISDQDDSGAWMRREFPDLFYIVSPGGYGAATWTGIMHVEAGFENATVRNRWLAENIQQGHGPLGAIYPDVSYGMEGDTPSWLGLIPNGLSVPEHPDWGGWGGRYEFYTPAHAALDPQGFTGGVPVEPETRPIWTNAVDEFTPTVPGEFGRAARAGEKTAKGFRVPIWRWRDEFQHDFAARMDWTTRPYADANHPPVPRLAHAAALTVKSGETFQLDATGSSDPDGDSLSFWWMPYPEAGSYRGPLTLNGAANSIRAHFVAPKVDKPETLHVILRLTDKGTPALTRYRRIIVTVLPE